MDDAVRQLLESIGLQPTPNRLRVLAVLIAANSPMNAREVYQKAVAATPVNRVTVYRILDLLADKGIVNKISTGERSYRYCARQAAHPHGHFHCLKCQAVMCVESEAIASSKSALMTLPFDIHSIDLRLDGICPTCREKDCS